MKKKILIIILIIILVVIVMGIYVFSGLTGINILLGGFCGTSTDGYCNSYNDCTTGGCSGEICQNKSEGPYFTPCMFRSCYDDKKFNVICGCFNNKCKWSK